MGGKLFEVLHIWKCLFSNFITQLYSEVLCQNWFSFIILNVWFHCVLYSRVMVENSEAIWIPSLLYWSFFSQEACTILFSCLQYSTVSLRYTLVWVCFHSEWAFDESFFGNSYSSVLGIFSYVLLLISSHDSFYLDIVIPGLVSFLIFAPLFFIFLSYFMEDSFNSSSILLTILSRLSWF